MSKQYLETSSQSKIIDLQDQELERQNTTLNLIPSENYASKYVLSPLSGSLHYKYAEGTCSNRYYNGCGIVNQVEEIAIKLACELFQCKFANVQPHSGSQANQAIFLALLNPGDTIVAMNLKDGGHLTHGSKVNLSGKIYNVIHYGVKEDGKIDIEEVRRLCMEHKPKMLIGGFSSYTFTLEYRSLYDISRQVGAYMFLDLSHISGLIAGKAIFNPIQYCDVLMTTTHKGLRGPKGALILSNDSNIMSKIDKGVFPGVQGGPFMNNIASKALCLERASEESFSQYCINVLKNTQAFHSKLLSLGFPVLYSHSENHMVLCKVSEATKFSNILETHGMICNVNFIPGDMNIPSGIRMGTTPLTTRGATESHFMQIAELINNLYGKFRETGEDLLEQDVKRSVSKLANTLIKIEDIR